MNNLTQILEQTGELQLRVFELLFSLERAGLVPSVVDRIASQGSVKLPSEPDLGDLHTVFSELVAKGDVIHEDIKQDLMRDVNNEISIELRFLLSSLERMRLLLSRAAAGGQGEE